MLLINHLNKNNCLYNFTTVCITHALLPGDHAASVYLAHPL